jgi:hypothetical protein
MPEAFDAALRNRLISINGLGDQANTQAAALAQRRAQIAAQQQYQSYQNSYSGMPSASASNLGPRASGDNFSSFLRAISKRESGGNYGAVNRDSGALGKYQIMPGNIPSWSKEALGHSVSANQFRNSPALQEKIAQYKLQQYYKQFGAQGAAVAWYAGPGTAKKYLRAGGRGYNQPQGKYSSISAYALGILRSMGLR